MADENYVSGYPPPPYYFKEYQSMDIKKLMEISNFKSTDEESFLEHLRKSYETIYDVNRNTYIKDIKSLSNIKNCEFIMGRPPPLPLRDSYNVFGMEYKVERNIEELDSDEILYDEKKNLKEEFIRIYKIYKETFFLLFDDIVNNRKDDKSKIKQLTKIHVNLFHILAKLRHYQTINNIVNVLKIQLKKRQIAIDKMKISLLNVYQYINFVQTNCVNKNMITNEENDEQKKLK
ncbi:mediator of RNA polymerase II transcription subunit 7, putative [Plasmodium sp. gorilla clade G2]|uniref:mediator of RNA polymerase II transcription subunit 7, putative n=1 Tax=Plasmodium sp. gorilla clade G2 TaxID=880535 RepID=UPI000D2196BF|nr:mediator of RNA polymerase II transcription subunit 7, putative [Plasmodium sp. gorilla clade G2]SOV13768.1 mediator of RNA polymerase II transcription subunit 7, putative [Plasmodium sp. gorilla clade G2]